MRDRGSAHQRNHQGPHPAVYENRPRPIHLEVKIDGTEALTSQIHFIGDPLLSSDGVARGLSDAEPRAMSVTTVKDEAVLGASHLLVVDA